MLKTKIKFTLPADLKFSSFVRHISKDLFHQIGFSSDWAYRLELVVDELYMNACRYGSSTKSSRIFFDYSFDKNELIFCIDDEGLGNKKMNANILQKLIDKNSDELADLTKTSGRGLALISHLWTDSMQIKDNHYGGISICFKKSILNDIPPLSEFSISSQHKIEDFSLSSSNNPIIEVGISGEVDASNLQEKIKLIINTLSTLPEHASFVLDCDGLVYVNSTFIGYLSSWLNQVRRKHGHFILKNVDEKIKEILSLVGLDKVIYFES